MGGNLVEPLIDCEKAAIILDISPRTLQRKAYAGEIPAIKMGKHWKFRATELDAWITAQLQLSRQPRPQMEGI
jgi:excisionase family DNA binding protein